MNEGRLAGATADGTTSEMPMLQLPVATVDAIDLVAGWKHQLIQDEGHRNPMTVPRLADCMRGWLAIRERAAQLAASERDEAARQQWRAAATDLDVNDLVVVDEAGTHRATAVHLSYGRPLELVMVAEAEAPTALRSRSARAATPHRSATRPT